MAGNLTEINGQLYTIMNPGMDAFARGMGIMPAPTSGNLKPGYLTHLLNNNIVKPYQMQPQVQPQAPQPAGNGMMKGKLPDMYNRLTMQANDALYGGILGYQPKPITSPTGNQYQPPTNQGFQFPFGLLNRNFLGS